MIDRLVHHAEILALKGDSYRLKDRDLARPAAPPATTRTRRAPLRLALRARLRAARRELSGGPLFDRRYRPGFRPALTEADWYWLCSLTSTTSASPTTSAMTRVSGCGHPERLDPDPQRRILGELEARSWRSRGRSLRPGEGGRLDAIAEAIECRPERASARARRRRAAFTGSSSVPIHRPHPSAPLSCVELDSEGGAAPFASLRQRRCSSSVRWQAALRGHHAHASDAPGSAESHFCEARRRRRSTASATRRPDARQQRSKASADHSGALRRRVETRCRVTPKRSAICSIVRPSA